tara:strand:- start:424 stop:648 length:225 start_codon:yes stop_codon:yes gene_type:complete
MNVKLKTKTMIDKESKNNILKVCPTCKSPEIKFMVWANPNDKKTKAIDCEDDECFDGYCSICEESIKHYEELNN